MTRFNKRRLPNNIGSAKFLEKANLMYALLLEDKRIENFTAGLLEMAGSKEVNIITPSFELVKQLKVDSSGKADGVSIVCSSEFSTAIEEALANDYVIMVDNHPDPNDINTHVLYQVILFNHQWKFTPKSELDKYGEKIKSGIDVRIKTSNGDFSDYWKPSDFLSIM